MSQPIALYLHIPFCETKCPYCDFNTYAGIEHLVPQYVDALARELRLWGQALASEHPAWSGGPLLSANASLSPFIPLPSREEGSIG
ncbi:MAG: hypothetical protein HY532_04490, partial [Chloroflexi bacterium]|nr:hypothetical protein [Chloroflexota bacterium]